MYERGSYPSFSSISCIEVLTETHLLRVYSGAFFFEQMFWSLALPCAVALHPPSLGWFSPFSLVRWAAGLDVNDYRLQLCLLQGGLVGNHSRTKLLNLPIAIGNVAWKEAGNKASIIIILPTTLMRNLCILQSFCTHVGSYRVLLRTRVCALTSRNVDHSQIYGSPKKTTYEILLRRMKGRIKRSQPFVIF